MTFVFNKMNKKGDFASIIYLVIILFIIGVFIFFMNHLTNQVYGSLDTYFDESAKYNNTLAETAVEDINTADNSMWDYGFLGISIGLLITLIGSAYSTRISPIFYWLYAILGIIIMVLAVILSNTWQTLAANAEFANTITRFPITNALLGTYYPTFILAAMMLAIIFLFGKGNER